MVAIRLLRAIQSPQILDSTDTFQNVYFASSTNTLVSPQAPARGCNQLHFHSLPLLQCRCSISRYPHSYMRSCVFLFPVSWRLCIRPHDFDSLSHSRKRLPRLVPAMPFEGGWYISVMYSPLGAGSAPPHLNFGPPHWLPPHQLKQQRADSI